jgi:hypothetical protein
MYGFVLHAAPIEETTGIFLFTQASGRIAASSSISPIADGIFSAVFSQTVIFIR